VNRRITDLCRLFVLRCMLFAIVLQATAGAFAHHAEHIVEDAAAIATGVAAHACAVQDDPSHHAPEASTVCAWCAASVKPLLFDTLPVSFQFVAAQSIPVLPWEFSRTYCGKTCYSPSVRDPPNVLI
jgi:hypothetical protein